MIAFTKLVESRSFYVINGEHQLEAQKKPMVDQISQPTQDPDVDLLLHRLLVDIQTVLRDRFVGMYLYGSLATGGFDPEQSDIDFVVITTGPLPEDVVQELEALHARIAASDLKGAAKLEGAYVPQHIIRRHDPEGPPVPSINEGKFYLAPLGSDWVIQRHVLRERGVVVAGPDPDTLIDPVDIADVRRAILGFLREWWAPMLDDPDPRMEGSEYQSYAVLTMCRALYTLEYGTIESKLEAARWAQRALDEQWAPLIAWAAAWRGDGEPKDIDEILAFVRYALEQSQTVKKEAAPSPDHRR